MAATPEDLLAYLRELGIESTVHEHPPLRTVEDSRRLRGALPGGHCKNLFLKDKKGQYWLLVAEEDREVDLKSLQGLIGAARLSFGRAERLEEVLGVMPGAVTPFALINDPEHRVKVVLDGGMLRHARLNYHPLVNTQTLALRTEDVRRFLEATGHEVQIIWND